MKATIPDCRELIHMLPDFDPYRDSAGYEFSEHRAQKAIDFFHRELRHCKGPTVGKAFELLPWQQAIAANIWGWRRISDGVRRFRRALLLVPKKQGKSCFGAGCVMKELRDAPYGSEIYSAAASVRQGNNVFDHVVGMLQLSRKLQKLFKLYGGFGGNCARSIFYKEKFSKYMVIAADSNTADGSNISMALVDELHRFTTSKHYDFCQVMEKSTAARPDSLIFYTTTAGVEGESVCNEIRDYAHKVQKGVIRDARFLPVCYELGKDEDWHDPENWRRVNPSLGVTIQEDFLEMEHEKAVHMPSSKNSFLRLHLNVTTQSADSWLSCDDWDKLHKNFDEKYLEGRECFGGLDLSRSDDLTAFSLIFPEDGAFYCLNYFWVPNDGLDKKERESNAPYTLWRDNGEINAIDGEIIDYNVVEEFIIHLSTKFKIKEIAADPQWAQQLLTNLEGRGMKMVKFTQSTMNYNGPVQELEALISARKIYHNGNPVMRYCVGNVSLKEEAQSGRCLPSKQRSSGKIDGVTSLLMALGRYMVKGKSPVSIYTKRGLFE